MNLMSNKGNTSIHNYLCVDKLGATQRLIEVLKERRTNMFFKSWEACLKKSVFHPHPN